MRERQVPPHRGRRETARAVPLERVTALPPASRLARPWTLGAGIWAHIESPVLVVAQAAILASVALALLWPAPIKPNELPAAHAESDLIISHWPSALLIKRTIAAAHHLPLWNPYWAGGRPLAADPLAALFYPPTQLVNFFNLRDYFLVLLLAHLVWAGVGALLLARRALGLSRPAALVVGIAYMATPRMIGHLGAGHVTLVQTVAWLPWLALGCWATVRNPRRYAVPFGVALALTVLAGHPQLAYYGLMMVAAVAAWLLARRWWADGRRVAAASVVGLVIAGALGVLLAAVHLVPLMQFTALSTRQVSVDPTDAYPLHDVLRALLGHQRPSAVPWEDVFQPGRYVLYLAVLGLLARWRVGIPILAGVVLAAGLAMGQSSPIYHLAAHVLPSFERFHAVARIWFLGLLGIALLAGLGVEALLRLMRRVTVPGAVVIGLVCVLLVSRNLIDTDATHAQIADVAPSVTTTAVATTAARLAGTGRIYGVERNVPQVDAVELGVPLADGWDPLLLESYVRFMQRAGGYTFEGYQLTIPPVQAQPDAALLGLMHVSVVVSQIPLIDQRFIEVDNVDGTLIYRNTADAGLGYVVAAGAEGRVPTLDELRQVAVSLDRVDLARERDRFDFTAFDSGYFVVAMPKYPGWTARLDGHVVPVETIGGVLPAIKVGPGAHTLTYAYDPISVKLGATLSGLGLLIVAGWLALSLRARARPRATQRPSAARP